jgi:hypothetical protein
VELGFRDRQVLKGRLDLRVILEFKEFRVILVLLVQLV